MNNCMLSCLVSPTIGTLLACYFLSSLLSIFTLYLQISPLVRFDQFKSIRFGHYIGLESNERFVLVFVYVYSWLCSAVGSSEHLLHYVLGHY